MVDIGSVYATTLLGRISLHGKPFFDTDSLVSLANLIDQRSSDMWRWLWNRMGAKDSIDRHQPNPLTVTVLYAKVHLNVESAPLAIDPQSQPRQRSAKSRARRIRARRFANRFTDMSSRDARMLFAIHRRSVKAMANESPAVLQRDLQRFALSSRGHRISHGKPVATVAKVRVWVAESRQMMPVARLEPLSSVKNAISDGRTRKRTAI